MKKYLIAFSFIFVAGVVFSGTLDGVVNADEYEVEVRAGKMTVYFDKSSGGSLSLAVTSPGKGWIAIGFGSPRMNNSHIIMGYFKNGETFLTEEMGRGHSHATTQEEWIDEAVVKDSDEGVTLELILNEKAFSFGTDDVPVILAYGRGDDFRSMHVSRTAVTVDLN